MIVDVKSIIFISGLELQSVAQFHNFGPRLPVMRVSQLSRGSVSRDKSAPVQGEKGSKLYHSLTMSEIK